MAQIIEDEKLQYALALVERSIKGLSVEGRTIWTPHEIDPVINDMLDLWKILHSN